jgi:glycerol-3-phosphate acyltransferase PlsY
MDALQLIMSAILGYLLGSIPFGLVLVKAAGLGDIRAIGSGNIGATNVLRTGRKDLAAATLLLDSGKAAIALMLARIFFDSDAAGLVAGASAFLGHCYPVWLRFNGGKGVATFFGVLLAGLPFVGLAAGSVWILSAILFRFSSLAALLAAATSPIVAFFLAAPQYRTMETGFCVALAIMIFLRHHANIARLANGTEPRIGQKKDEDDPTPAPSSE